MLYLGPEISLFVSKPLMAFIFQDKALLINLFLETLSDKFPHMTKENIRVKENNENNKTFIGFINIRIDCETTIEN